MRIMNLLIPGIRAIAETNECALIFNGAVPTIERGGLIANIDCQKAEEFAENDDYSSLSEYINKVCENMSDIATGY